MTIREAGKGIVTAGWGTYRIGYIDEDGFEAETEMNAYNMMELNRLYQEFCKDNGMLQNTVRYVSRV